jgi:N-acetylneuraminic acid mutarotase
MFVIGGWNGHDTMDDMYQYSFLSNLWFEIRRIKGVRPKPRYRHSAVAHGSKILIFGGVDTTQQRFNDIFVYDSEGRLWDGLAVTGTLPQQRTFHKAIIAQNVMYVVGGFDGSRLNDMFNIALDRLPENSDSDCSSICSARNHVRPPTSAASGIMQTVPSDLSVHGGAVVSDAASDIANESEDNLIKWNDREFLRKKIKLLQ